MEWVPGYRNTFDKLVGCECGSEVTSYEILGNISRCVYDIDVQTFRVCLDEVFFWGDKNFGEIEIF